MSLLDNLRSAMLADSNVQAFYASLSETIGAVGAIAENRLDQAAPDTKILYYLAGTERDLSLDGQVLQATYTVDCEVHSSDIANADALADILRAKWDGFQGEIVSGGYYAWSIFVADYDETYIPKQNMLPDCIHILALRLTVLGGV